MLSIIEKLIALFLLMLLQPLFLLISILIIINDGFPIIYIQQNYGKNHKKFYLYKFRTMKQGTPEMPTEEFSEPEKYVLWYGKFLRRFSLDELPQLLNIIQGEMSFIGPRPCMVKNEEIVKNLREEKGIEKLKPGITGWAQINGRDLNSFSKKVELDHYYLLNKSLWLDLKIIVKTFYVILYQKNIRH
tara:strand:- start:8306 stop:8869 length:564 start_codon:yes stop_codon:yes gene_type:complete